MAEISNPNYNDQEEHGGTKKCMEVKLSSIQGEYGRKRTLYQGLTVPRPQSI